MEKHDICSYLTENKNKYRVGHLEIVICHLLYLDIAHLIDYGFT